ncbi:fibrinogen-like protein 1 [Drosophila busckii]|uniref:fibrinogen-like protein 1 n=1 Tax=Drosophila busckii TaxID=30019 RepID=UPI0014328975|nr:fibrinogen-like protein 1 [Drosophila busckii]
MCKPLLILLLSLLAQQICAGESSLGALNLQTQLHNSLNNIEKLQAIYKNEIEEALTVKRNMAIESLIKQQINGDLTKCKHENKAAQELNRMYADQITGMQNKLNTYIAEVEDKDHQLEQAMAIMHDYTTTIKEQSKQIELLKYQLIMQADNNELKTGGAAAAYAEPNSCLAFVNSTGVHSIKVDAAEPFEVLCDAQLAGSGWTVVQRRINGSVKFYRDWSDYRAGFGELHGEFFIGLDKLYRLTNAQPHELYVQLTDFNNDTAHAYYDRFVIGAEYENYALIELGEYSGNAGDALRDNEQQSFSTFDRDNDKSKNNCAQTCLGGWWFNNCGLSNLNGQYAHNDDYYDSMEYGIYWDEWHGAGYTLQAVQIMIRPKPAADLK